MLQIDPDFYGTSCARLVRRETICPLGPGAPNEALRAVLETLDPSAIAKPHAVNDLDMAQCCMSALWLRHDFLDQSHRISQHVATPTGSYWHGIMHRREGDFSNSKYWFRKVGDHPIFSQLSEHSEAGDWDPFAFVDACQSAVNSGGSDETCCRQLQQLEWEILFDYCYTAAIK